MGVPGPPGTPLARLAVAVVILGTGAGVFGKECSIGLLQWNIHGECFRHCSSWHDHHCDREFPRCNQAAPAFLQSELQHDSMDFAGVEQLENRGFLMHGVRKDVWGQVQHTCGGRRGFGQWPFDIAVLFFNRRRWRELPSARRGGCMEKIWRAPIENYRAYVMQAFERVDGSAERVLVVVAHYPHRHGIYRLQNAIRELRKETGADRLILMADTNRPFDYSSVAVMRQVYPAMQDVSSTTLHHTCCFPHFRAGGYDRIIASGFPGAKHPMETKLPFRAHWGVHSPPWAAINMHDPVRGHLTYRCDGN